MAFYVFIVTTDQRRIKVGPFVTRQEAVAAVAAAMQGDLTRVDSIEISGDVLPHG